MELATGTSFDAQFDNRETIEFPEGKITVVDLTPPQQVMLCQYFLHQDGVKTRIPIKNPFVYFITRIGVV